MVLPVDSPATSFINAANDEINRLSSKVSPEIWLAGQSEVMDNVQMSDAPSRQEVDAKIAASAAGTLAEFQALRGDMATAKAETKEELSALRVQIADMRTEMRTGFAELRADMHEMNAGISRWMLGTVLTIVGTMVIGLGGLTITLYNTVKPSASAAIQTPTPQQQPIIINIPAPPPAAMSKK